MNQRTEHLAYGKRRLLEIAIALACEPRVLLLDEPVAGVPAGEREELLQTVAALPADVSVLLIEHDMDLVFSFAKRMTVLVNGARADRGRSASRSPTIRRSRRCTWATARNMGRWLMAELLRVDRLSAGYGEAVVLQDVSLSLDEGRTLALLGRNGTGKTTLDQHAGGRHAPAWRSHRAGRRGAAQAGRAPTRGGRHRLGAAGAQHLQVADGAREPHGRGAAGQVDAGGRLRDVPAAGGAQGQPGHAAVRRRAADAGRGPRAGA